MLLNSINIDDVIHYHLSNRKKIILLNNISIKKPCNIYLSY